MDPFSGDRIAPNSPAVDAYVIAPSDTLDLPVTLRAIYVGNGGTIVGTLAGDGTPVTFVNLGSGSIYPLRFKRIFATGTTATSLIGLD